MLAYTLAMVNGLALVDGYGNLVKETAGMEKKPGDFTKLYLQIIEESDAEEILTLCRKMIQGVRELLKEEKENAGWQKEEKELIHYEDLAYWYQEARYTFRKIAYYTKAGDAPQCYSLGCYLQIEFDAIQKEFCLEEMDLLGAFDVKHLDEFAERAQKLEDYLIHVMEEHNVRMNRFASLEEFLEKQRIE